MAKKKQNRLKTKSMTFRITESQYAYIRKEMDDNALKISEWFDQACCAKNKMTLVEWRKL